MQFISSRVHGYLDYAVAVVLIAAPLLLGFADSSFTAAVLSVGAGIGLAVYSLLTDYSAGVRTLISLRAHLVLDSIAATALLIAPFVLGFGGVPRIFFLSVAVAVFAVVATTRRGDAPNSDRIGDEMRAGTVA